MTKDKDPLNWKCAICGAPADYKQSKNKFCVEHWRNGDPVRVTFDNCLEARMPEWYRRICKEKNAH